MTISKARAILAGIQVFFGTGLALELFMIANGLVPNPWYVWTVPIVLGLASGFQIVLTYIHHHRERFI